MWAWTTAIPINWFDSRQWEDCAHGDWDVHKFRTGYVKFKIPMTDGKFRWISIYSMCVYIHVYGKRPGLKINLDI